MGSPLVEQLIKWEIGEESTDCGQCIVKTPAVREEYPRPYKCCTFQPFWSAFLVGDWLSQNPEGDPNIDGAIYLPVGLVPPPQKRKLQVSLSPETRARTQELRCNHFGDDGHCQIFASRPIECRRYYCSGQSSVKTRYRNMVFESLLTSQANLLREFTMESYDEADWELWSEYLEARGFEFEPHKPMETWEEARNYYLKAHQWLIEKGEAIEWPMLPMLDRWHEIYRRTPTEIG